MKRFRDFLKEDKGLDVDSIFPDHEKPLGNINDDHDAEGLFKISRVAIENHYDEMLAFFRQLATKDHQIQDQLDDMNRHKINKARPKNKMPAGHNGEHDNEVVPSGADRADGGGGTEQGGGGGPGN